MSVSSKILNRFSSERLQQIGEVAVLAGSIEFRLERAIWAISKEEVLQVKPTTDGQTVSGLIKRFKTFSEDVTDHDFKVVLNLWTEIAAPAFRCRNSILHGLAIVYDDHTAEFITNTQWNGELRKYNSASFHVTDNTLGQLGSIFKVLLDSIMAIEAIADNKLAAKDFFTTKYIATMSDYRSLANEIVDLAAAVNHEKY